MSERKESSATAIGVVAADVLRHADDLEVIAVFERSFYVMAANGIVAVCATELGHGPLNVLVPSARGPFDGAVRSGTKGRATAQIMTFDSGLVISLARALPWHPPPAPTWQAETVATRLAQLAPLAEARCPVEGLSPLVFAPARRLSRTGQAAQTVVASLSDELPQCIANANWSKPAVTAATLLVGLGPGLTPSGDDLLGGIMLGLTARGLDGLRDQLWDHLVPELDDLTVPISAMHLSAAADGLAHESLHATMQRMMSANDASWDLEPVSALGATSGWDALAGLVLAMRP